jgi:hypothetical protein
MTRCPFSLSRLVKVTPARRGRAFPDPHADGVIAGPKRNFQIFWPLDFLAEFTQHIPPTGSHPIRYYGWYSNPGAPGRGLRKKRGAGATAQSAASSGGQVADVPASSCSSQTWAMLIKRVYEVDPLSCPRCGSEMKVVTFIDPPQGEVIEKILKHCGLWRVSAPRAPPQVHDDATHELPYVDCDTLVATFEFTE